MVCIHKLPHYNHLPSVMALNFSENNKDKNFSFIFHNCRKTKHTNKHFQDKDRPLETSRSLPLAITYEPIQDVQDAIDILLGDKAMERLQLEDNSPEVVRMIEELMEQLKKTSPASLTEVVGYK